MKWELKTATVPIKSWCEFVEPNAMEQVYALADLSFAFHHIALMPDCHAGVGMPIGGVLATRGVIVPNAVGCDIGCGMAVVQTTINVEMMVPELIEKIRLAVMRDVPVGFAHHNESQQWDTFDIAPIDIPVVKQELDSARRQLGTLGGGNHFIEIQKGSDGLVWLMLHSGSRNFGLKIAQTYDKIARQLSPTGNRELCGLPIDSDMGKEYFRAMNFALAFAEENRKRMMTAFKKQVEYYTHCHFTNGINIHHNYAHEEEHFGEKVIVHRKGATSAKLNEYGIIPGSMGTASYIVQGKGNPESFQSCSHGAGRKMGRGQANRTLSVDDCNKAMQGIVFSGFKKNKKGQHQVDEAPMCYKDIDDVIQSETDLVEPIVKLYPIGVIKGD